MFDITGDAYGEIVIKSDIKIKQIAEINLLAFETAADDKDNKRYLIYLKDNSINLDKVSKGLDVLSKYISFGYVKFNNLKNSEVWEISYTNNEWTHIVPV